MRSEATQLADKYAEDLYRFVTEILGLAPSAQVLVEAAFDPLVAEIMALWICAGRPSRDVLTGARYE